MVHMATDLPMEGGDAPLALVRINSYKNDTTFASFAPALAPADMYVQPARTCPATPRFAFFYCQCLFFFVSDLVCQLIRYARASVTTHTHAA